MEQKKYDNTNRGALWDNREKKRPGKSDPDFSGKIDVNGVEMNLSAWINENPAPNQPAFSLSVRPITPKASQPGQPVADASTGIPF